LEIVVKNFEQYSAYVNQVTGTYRNGTVVLDEPVDWPEGIHVEVVCESDAHGAAEDVCLDGSAWQNSPEAIQTWNDWFDSLEPVFTGEELARFEAELRSARADQKVVLPQWEQRIARLPK